MSDNVATQILDDLTEHDVKKVRVEASIRRKVTARMDELQQDLRRLADEIDPTGTVRMDARARRAKKLEKQSRELIRQAYADINTITRQETVKLVGIESDAVVGAMELHIP